MLSPRSVNRHPLWVVFRDSDAVLHERDGGLADVKFRHEQARLLLGRLGRLDAEHFVFDFHRGL